MIVLIYKEVTYGNFLLERQLRNVARLVLRRRGQGRYQRRFVHTHDFKRTIVVDEPELCVAVKWSVVAAAAETHPW